jgi:hypothetical protein
LYGVWDGKMHIHIFRTFMKAILCTIILFIASLNSGNICCNSWQLSKFNYDGIFNLNYDDKIISPQTKLIYMMCRRFQWFWQFFRNSIFFMCFWFGLEMLRLVYKKAFLKYWTITYYWSYLTFYPPKKVAPPLIRVLKNFFKIGHTGYQKKQNFALISKCA